MAKRDHEEEIIAGQVAAEARPRSFGWAILPIRRLIAEFDARALRKGIRHPGRAVRRLIVEARLARASLQEQRAGLCDFLSERFGVDARALADEFARSQFLRWFRKRRAALTRHRGPLRLGTTGEFGCEALYLLVRAARPRVVVDTGVLYGASSAHILAALAQNGEGELHSIDLERDPREPPHDYFVPHNLRDSWKLIRGDSRHELPSLLRRCGTIDMFYHDSLHTFDHMMWEFGTAFPYLSSGGVLASDDVVSPARLLDIFRPNAFTVFCRAKQVAHEVFQNLGIALVESRSTVAWAALIAGTAPNCLSFA